MAASTGEDEVSGELLLVGSIPLDTPQEVFESFGAPLGRYLFAMPDGEVGPRRHWISRVHYQVLAAHPELEVVQQRRRCLVVQGQGRREGGALRRSRLASRL